MRSLERAASKIEILCLVRVSAMTTTLTQPELSESVILPPKYTSKHLFRLGITQ
jgi:hypothetical protein